MKFKQQSNRLRPRDKSRAEPIMNVFQITRKVMGLGLFPTQIARIQIHLRTTFQSHNSKTLKQLKRLLRQGRRVPELYIHALRDELRNGKLTTHLKREHLELELRRKGKDRCEETISLLKLEMEKIKALRTQRIREHIEDDDDDVLEEKY